MASKIEIWNRSLQKLGAKRVQDVNDDSPNARSLRVAYEPVKLRLLRSHRWNFSIKRINLPADATAPIFGRANAFQLPSDWVKMANDYPEQNFNDKDWVVEGTKIYTNEQAPLPIRYVSNVDDPNQMDASFRELLSTELAYELCEEITQSNTKKSDLRMDKKEIISEARKANAFDKVAQEFPEDTFITVRV